jgi:aminocarboxymuconate-semialdehyde decarboxylase
VLPGEDSEASTASGRPIGSEYTDVSRKLAFMDRHGIAASVLSLANPWIDFLPPAAAPPVAAQLNDEMQRICEDSRGRIFGFGVLPLSAGAPACVAEVERIAARDRLRGIIIGTTGAGKGLDDEALRDVWAALADKKLVSFVHPHYGVGNEHFAGTGHALFLALGFPFETTVAVSRLVLSGEFDRNPSLKLLLAHSGGTLPFLAGRLDSCVAHDIAVSTRLKHAPSSYIKNLYFDSIQYQAPSLQCVVDLAGADRIMFGTDHPFFPPPGVENDKMDNVLWTSTVKNYDILDGLKDKAAKDGILRDNACKLLNITLPRQ